MTGVVWSIRRWHAIVNRVHETSNDRKSRQVPSPEWNRTRILLRQQSLGILNVRTYHAGLWSRTLILDLLWEVPLELRKRASEDCYLGPSWSWASRNHPVKYSDDFAWGGRESKVTAVEVIPKDPNLPNGAVKSAKITISCGAEEVLLPKHMVFLDDEPQPEELDKVCLLDLASEEPYNTAYFVGLAVRRGRDQPIRKTVV